MSPITGTHAILTLYFQMLKYKLENFTQRNYSNRLLDIAPNNGRMSFQNKVYMSFVSRFHCEIFI